MREVYVAIRFRCVIGGLVQLDTEVAIKSILGTITIPNPPFARRAAIGVLMEK